ncbi:MAG: hypothetical protein U1D06_16235, partial [Paracoccaceae bacterium]|nr:hypothetical protein [Paracoccaceae bacterium]
MRILDKPSDSWCLVLALWGEKYHANHVNELVRSTRTFSPGCEKIVLVTDRIRPDIDPDGVQSLIPAFFNRAA